MTDNTQPEAGSTHIIRYALEMGLLWIDDSGRDKVREALYALDTLEAQLESIGAGGVNGPLMGQPQAMPDLSALTERGAMAWAGVDAQGLRECFTAADMATAAAQGFRDGVASLAASAGSEPVATIKSWTNGSYWRNYNVVFHRDDLPVGTDLYTHPSPPEGIVGGWRPIETAPKDGTEIILRRGDRIGCAIWCHWPATEIEEAGAGWSVGLDGYTWDCQDAPTHWMPLPPTSAEGVEHG